jgi:hypothetical protein
MKDFELVNAGMQQLIGDLLEKSIDKLKKNPAMTARMSISFNIRRSEDNEYAITPSLNVAIKGNQGTVFPEFVVVADDSGKIKDPQVMIDD